MKQVKDLEVAIVGAGPVGQFAALLLARKGRSVGIFDNQPHRAVHSYALTLHSRTLAQLESMDLFSDLLPYGSVVRRLCIHGDEGMHVEVDLAEARGVHPFVMVVGQSTLEGVLEKALRATGVRIQWNHRVVAVAERVDGVELRVDELEDRVIGYAVAHNERMVRKSFSVHADFVLGADGCNSLVRHALGIPFPEVGNAESYHVYEFTTREEPTEDMDIVDRAGFLQVRWPVARTGYRWALQVGDQTGRKIREDREKNPALVQWVGNSLYEPLARRDFQEILRQQAPDLPVSVDNLYWNVLVRFERRLAASFGRDRVWLAGDAAHLTGPIGVQSMNVGILEAIAFAEQLDQILDGKAGPESLEIIAEQHRGLWMQYLGLEDFVQPSDRVPGALVKRGSEFFSWLPASGDDLTNLLIFLGYEVMNEPCGSL